MGRNLEIKFHDEIVINIIISYSYLCKKAIIGFLIFQNGTEGSRMLETTPECFRRF
jgi:hypothetical protein